MKGTFCMNTRWTFNRLACRKLMIVLILVAFLAGCAPFAAKPTSATYWPTNGWQTTKPEEQGMDSELLAQMVEHIQKKQLNIHSLLIVRNGYLVSELYVYPYSAGQAHGVMSVTKSVLGTLVGIAIQQGYIKDVHQPLLSLLPDQEVANLDDQKRAITLEDLLTLTSGLDCPDIPAPGEKFMETSENWVQFMLDQSVVDRPGTKFNYCTSTIHLVSAVLQKATGMSARKFANQNLFGPIGVGPIPEERWPSDPQGVSVGGYGLSLTPDEMAKLGYLYLNQGQWDGKAVVPAKWVVASTSSHANRGDKKEYGYLWWIDPQKEWYAALGRAGQHIFVYPAENLVVVFTATLPFTNDADLVPLQELLNQYILPAVKSNEPLASNSNSLAHLEAGIRALAQPQPMTPQPLPAIATQISGKTYTLEDNPFGWHSVIFTFEEGGDEARVTIDGMRQLRFGLDNVYRLFSLNNNPFPEALRGRWENQNTFVLEDIVLGQTLKIISRIHFSGETLHIDWEETSSERKVELRGTLKPATK
jgi:CubicO group peptidase (beta-lactamase class C family)